MKQTEPSLALRRLMIVAAVLCLAGVAVSVELTRIHLFVHTDPSYHSVCAMSEGVNCETVAASPYSVVAGLPVSIWGILGYLLMGTLALWALGRHRLHPRWPLGLLLSLVTLAVAASALLAFVSAAWIDSFCLFCVGSYTINVALLVVCVLALRQTQARFLVLLSQDLEALYGRRWLALSLPVAGLIAVGALQLAVPPYWKTLGWEDLPKLAAGIDANGHHWIGAPTPKVTIVEFSDYQCPHCRAAHKDVRALAAKYAGAVRLVHRHLPLDTACHPGLRRPFHAYACLFAEAAECAGLQGRFWEMNDALFFTQETVKASNVDPVDLAVRIGLNRSEFRDCLASHATAKLVAADTRDAMTRNLKGTPSFLVGAQLFTGRVPEAELERLVNEGSAKTMGRREQEPLPGPNGDDIP